MIANGYWIEAIFSEAYVAWFLFQMVGRNSDWSAYLLYCTAGIFAFLHADAQAVLFLTSDMYAVLFVGQYTLFTIMTAFSLRSAWNFRNTINNTSVIGPSADRAWFLVPSLALATNACVVSWALPPFGLLLPGLYTCLLIGVGVWALYGIRTGIHRYLQRLSPNANGQASAAKLTSHKRLITHTLAGAMAWLCFMAVCCGAMLAHLIAFVPQSDPATYTFRYLNVPECVFLVWVWLWWDVLQPTAIPPVTHITIDTPPVRPPLPHPPIPVHRVQTNANPDSASGASPPLRIMAFPPPPNTPTADDTHTPSTPLVPDAVLPNLPELAPHVLPSPGRIVVHDGISLGLGDSPDDSLGSTSRPHSAPQSSPF